MQSNDVRRSENLASEQDGDPASARTRRETLTEALWGLDWRSHLPVVVCDGVSVHASTLEESLSFIRTHYASIFREDPDSPFPAGRVTVAKERYYRAAGDFFEFKSGGSTVALLVGTAADWSTYYIRSAAALPEFQGKKVIQRFFPRMFELLRAAGVERVEADTSPSNMATLHLLTRLRFNPTGTLLSDRCGALVHFTRFLDAQSEDVFVRRLCTGIPYQLRERTQHAAGQDGLEGTSS